MEIQTLGRGEHVMHFIVTAGFMVLDILTGFIVSIKNKTFQSSIMREGLFHKCGSISTILLGVLCDYGQQFLDLGFNVPVTLAICTYISVMEIGSIKENINKLNPQIKDGGTK